MDGKLKYAVFSTDWGYFGLLSTDMYLLKTVLPVKTASLARKLLTAGWDGAARCPDFLRPLQKKICDYFKGELVDFSDVRVFTENLSDFACNVLEKTRQIRYGSTISYSQLAILVSRPGTARSAGNILASNRLPLIIPCHRVIRSDGSIGGFSASGGSMMKEKMLKMEARYRRPG